MIGGAGSLFSKMARTKSRPDIDAMTWVGVTPYSTVGAADLSSMAISFFQLRSSYNVIELDASAANLPSRPGQARGSPVLRTFGTPAVVIASAAKQSMVQQSKYGLLRCAGNDRKRKP